MEATQEQAEPIAADDTPITPAFAAAIADDVSESEDNAQIAVPGDADAPHADEAN